MLGRISLDSFLQGAGVLLSIDSHDGTQVISPIVEATRDDEVTIGDS